MPTADATGPVDFAAVQFPTHSLTGAIVPELRKLTDAGFIRILDLLFVSKDAAGDVVIIELDEVDQEIASIFDELDGEIAELISREDADAIAESLPADTSAALIVWENIWAVGMASAVRASEGELLSFQRIPADIVAAALDS